jgi:serine O-acetyltransferase
MNEESCSMGLKDCFIIDYLSYKKENPGVLRIIRWMIFKQGYWVAVLYRIACYLKRMVLLGVFGSTLNKLIISCIRYKYSIELNLLTEIGPGIHFPHPHNIVIGNGVIIGREVTIFNGVTLGGKTQRDIDENIDRERRYPIIEDGVTIFTGAKVVGPITIGKGSVIGANAVVLDSFPPDSVIVGIPAKDVSQRARTNPG